VQQKRVVQMVYQNRENGVAPNHETRENISFFLNNIG